MKKLLATLSVIGLFGLMGNAGPAFAVADGQGIESAGSPHNAVAFNPNGELCQNCHVPHDHNKAEQVWQNGLLWNHELSAATYIMYGGADPEFSSFIDGAISPQPDGISKLCLGCHDGTVALGAWGDEIGVSTGSTMAQIPTLQEFVVPGIDSVDGGGNLDLRGTHPISIVYDSTADPGLADENATDFPWSGTSVASVLDNGKVQCSTCHDVHNTLGETVPDTHLLREPQNAATGGKASGLCLTCHVK